MPPDDDNSIARLLIKQQMIAIKIAAIGEMITRIEFPTTIRRQFLDELLDLIGMKLNEESATAYEKMFINLAEREKGMSGSVSGGSSSTPIMPQAYPGMTNDNLMRMILVNSYVTEATKRGFKIFVVDKNGAQVASAMPLGENP